MKRRKNGEGSYGEKKINGITYKYYRAVDGKMLYAKTMKELEEKKTAYLNSPTIRTIDSGYTFSEYCTKWLKQKRGISPKTVEDYEVLIDSHIKPYSIGCRPLKDLTPQMFEKYVEELSTKYSKATIHKTLAIINQTIKYGVANKELADIRLLNIKEPKEDEVKVKKREQKFISLEDMNLLYDVCYKDVNHIAGLIVVTIMYSGMRINEALNLRWCDVSSDYCQIHVKRSSQKLRTRDHDGQFIKKDDGTYVYEYYEKTPKTASGDRIVPLPKRAQSVLCELDKEQHGKNDYVFRTKDGRQYNYNMMHKPLKRMIKNAGLQDKDYDFHSLRRGYGSILLSKGVNIAVISKLLGHSKVSVTMNVYTKPFDKDVFDAVTKFDE